MRSNGQAFNPGIEKRDRRDRRQSREGSGDGAWAATEFQHRNFSEERVVAKKSVPLLDLTAMAYVVQINAALLNVEFVKHTVIADSQLEFGSALESLVWEISKLSSHVVDFVLDSIPHVRRKRIKCFGKRR